MDNWVGKPWQDLGRGSPGYDCWGLLRAAFEAETGVALPSHDGEYRSAADSVETKAVYNKELEDWVAVIHERRFDVVVSRPLGRWHVSLVVEPGKVLNIDPGGYSVIIPKTRLLRIEGTYRHRALAN